MSFIQYEILDPRPSSLEATLEQIHLWKAEGKRVIGFEVTVPQQTALMDQNIDPQHSGKNSSQSCIKAVFETHIIMNNDINYVFCTNRADLDSVGGMALYQMMADCDDIEAWSHRMYEQVKLVHEADIFAKGEWSPRPLFSQGYEQSALGAIARAVSDFKVPLSQRVKWMADWLWLNSPTELDAYQLAYEKDCEAIQVALESGETRVSTQDGIAVVESTLRSATTIGYAHAPVVVAYNPTMPSKNGPYKKFTVCQYAVGYCDLKAVLAELQEIESGWGGSPTIIGSPQETDTSLSISQVLAVVQRHLLK